MAEENQIVAAEATEKKAPAKKAAAKPAAEKKPAVKKETAVKKTPVKKAAVEGEAKAAPAKKAPAKKAAATGGITLKLTKSLIGRSAKQIATAKSMGLKRVGDTTVQPDNAPTTGKIKMISHMVEVTKA